MLLMVMMGEFINTGRIVGGGKLKRILMEHKESLPDIKISSKISKPIVQLRLRDKAGEEGIQMLDQYGREDAFVPNLYHLKYENYS